MNENPISKIFIAFFVLYILATGVFASLYNWRYARENGFVKWLLLGEVISTVKGVAWPYYEFFDRPPEPTAGSSLFKGWTKEEKDNAKHIVRSYEADLESIRLSNERTTPKFNDETKNEIIRLKTIALQEARLVTDDTLDKVHPQFREHFRNEYQRGIELRLLNMNDLSGNDKAESMGLELHSRWADWWNANKGQINIPKPSEESI